MKAKKTEDTIFDIRVALTKSRTIGYSIELLIIYRVFLPLEACVFSAFY